MVDGVVEVPSDIGNCRKLQRLHISENHFSFELPKEIGNLSQLVTFNASSNLLSGRIPHEIVNCKKLQRVDLSRNSFVGTLPNELGTFTQLEILRLSKNKFSGEIPAALRNLSRLTELQMGDNIFSVVIPYQLGSLSNLQISMNLSNNRLTGNIPRELGLLNMLEFLLLNYNNLTGEIPSTFESLSSLMVCNLSYNNLTGPLPTIPLFQNMPMSSFIENKGLCGRPLRNCMVDSSSSMLPAKNGTGGRIITIVAACRCCRRGIFNSHCNSHISNETSTRKCCIRERKGDATTGFGYLLSSKRRVYISRSN
ncbi:hypothetical protein V6N13_137668 [Hibiscus sabdariffa]